MVDIFSVVLVGGVVAFLMYRNINEITTSIEQKVAYSHSDFATFASYLQDKIREIKRDIDSDIECENPRFCKNDKCNEMKVIRELNELIRRASLYESGLVKNRKRSEVEADFIEILSRLEEIVKSSCVNGEKEADRLMDEIYNEYKRVVE
jgi:hypothetical protein